MSSSDSVLIIGAGAVGQAYGYHLWKGGAKVRFLVRDKYVKSMVEGLTVYPWNRRDRENPVHWDEFQVTADLEEGIRGVGVVLLAVPTNALFSGAWFSELTRALEDRTLVVLQPGSWVESWMTERVSSSQLVFGLISLCAWHMPLHDEDLPAGQAWWFPWGSRMGFSGPSERLMPLLAWWKRGGMPVAQRRDVFADQLMLEPVLTYIVISLELADWSVTKVLSRRELLTNAMDCMRCCWSWASRVSGKKPPLMLRALRPWMLRAGLRWLLPLAPLDLIRFFEVHFTKVADQTLLLLEHKIGAISDAGIDPGPLERTLLELKRKRGALQN